MHSEVVISRLALGTVQFGLPYGIANRNGQVARSEVKAMLQLAAAKGIDTLDTAIAYGESEACLGDVGTQGFKLVTKLPAVPDGCRDISIWVRQQVHASLSRLQVSRLYGLLLHRPEQLLGKLGKALYRALGDLKSQGLVGKIGVSIYAPDELGALCNGYTFDLVQTPFNVLDRRLADTGWLARLFRQGVEIHVRSIFLQGLLLMPADQRPPYFARWQQLLDVWDRWLVDHQLTSVQACLRHVLAFPEISKVVVGADSKAQLQEIILCAKGALPLLPSSLHASDLDLLNPARWERS